MTHVLTLQSKVQLTPDTHRYVFNKPDGLDFEAGQATELTLMKDGWRDEPRPFTFTSLPDESTLEFVIKSYPDHDGVTEQLAKLETGDTVEIVDPFGAISDHGPGVFIAAGAGITPFIPILEKHAKSGKMDCTLIFTNATEADVILREKWEKMDGLTTIFTVTDGENVDTDVEEEKVDKTFLKKHLTRFDRTFYLCGPEGFVNDVREALKALGADADKIVTEEGW
ncbi:FAD-binding oxidoreductase [Sulfitobacter guttiformis]|uniref:Ferredoxin-NADP reductase n=1 Tax=Sulfitobacter guttiformis TaxID=74349 RepID=A0A420DRE9_9RHOB|nr:FAD-binding oxidoreductase [Sulfitobacter guttiformis]KIN74199.1 FAD/NAD(P)-binding oxidoreductase [Sulfitobacter guttiformis KCTC 32187]RKE96812.1 ferredoxin-NADP reductase [Sulfitobacter guttiformis]